LLTLLLLSGGAAAWKGGCGHDWPPQCAQHGQNLVG